MYTDVLKVANTYARAKSKMPVQPTLTPASAMATDDRHSQPHLEHINIVIS